MSDEPNNNSMIPPDMIPPSEQEDIMPDPTDVVPDGGLTDEEPVEPIGGPPWTPPDPDPPVIV